MDVIELFKDSLVYPTKDFNKLLMFGVLFIVMGILTIFEAFGIALSQYIGADILAVISWILRILITLIVFGYTLNITGKTINNVEGDIPELNLVKNFIDGVKVLILDIVYFIIPFIVVLIIAFATGVFGNFYNLMTYTASGAASIPQALIASLGVSFLTIIIVGGIFFIIFALLFTIARAVLAETESLTAAIDMVAVFKKIGEIGWGNYILWIIIFIIVSIVLALITAIVTAIPFIGIIIALLVINSFVEMFSARAVGLLYNESKE